MTSIIHDQTKTESRNMGLSLSGGKSSRPTPARGQGGAHVRVVGVASILPMFDAPRETDWAFGLSPFAAFARRPLGSRDRRLGRPSRLSRPQFTPRSLDPDELHELRNAERSGRQPVLARAQALPDHLIASTAVGPEIDHSYSPSTVHVLDDRDRDTKGEPRAGTAFWKAGNVKRAKRLGEVGGRGGGQNSAPRIGTPEPFRDLLISIVSTAKPQRISA